MAVSKHRFQNDSSHRSPSDKRWKEFFRSKLLEDSKKLKTSNSLFWDWRHDVKHSAKPSKKGD